MANRILGMNRSKYKYTHPINVLMYLVSMVLAVHLFHYALVTTSSLVSREPKHTLILETTVLFI